MAIWGSRAIASGPVIARWSRLSCAVGSAAQATPARSTRQARMSSRWSGGGLGSVGLNQPMQLRAWQPSRFTMIDRFLQPLQQILAGGAVPAQRTLPVQFIGKHRVDRAGLGRQDVRPLPMGGGDDRLDADQ